MPDHEYDGDRPAGLFWKDEEEGLLFTIDSLAEKDAILELVNYLILQ